MNSSQKNIPKIMNRLAKHYNYQERTTLNRMRSSKVSNSKAFKILIACLLSLRARDENTEKVSKKLFRVASTPKTIANMPTKKLEKIIFSSGHYRKKAQSLKHVSKELIKNHKGKVPRTKEELLAIKGIGPKTANIVLNFAFNELVLPIDTHCHRIPNRLGWIKTKTAEKTELELNKILPKKYWLEFNALFVLFGKTICQPISPWCNKCPVSTYCPKINVLINR